MVADPGSLVEAPRNPVAFAMVGDVNDPGAASGTPYFALHHAARLGWPVRGLHLSADRRRWARRRFLWNASQMLTRGVKGGYQYSDAFLGRLWKLDPPRPGEDIINMFQLYPRWVMEQHEGRLFFFVDQTLKQMFDTYGLGLPDSVMRNAMSRERDQYHRATTVFTQSAYAARSVVQDYGVAPERVQAVVCGANLDADVLIAWETQARPARAPGPLRLVFVGKDWQRKGLDRLIAGIEVARAQGAEMVLRVIGVARADVPEAMTRVPGIDWIGFVDKRREAWRFVDLVADCDVGCLLSSAEAGGMSLREFCRLGLVTLAPDVGGSPEYVVPGASHLVRPEADVGSILHGLATDEMLLGRQKAVAWAERARASWDAPVLAMGAHLANGGKT